jgi:hypothetical protein
MTATSIINWTEVHQRVEQAAAVLTTRCVCDGYELDQSLVDKALTSCSGQDDGILEFAWQSGVPLGWLLLGDTAALICAAAAQAQPR